MSTTTLTKKISFHSRIYDRSGIELYVRKRSETIYFIFVVLNVISHFSTDPYRTILFYISIPSFLYVMYENFKYFGKQEPEGNFIGELILTPDTFTLGQETINTSDIKEMTINISHFKGSKNWEGITYTKDSGTENKIGLNVNGIIKNYNFQLVYKNQIDNLYKILEQLYIKNINVKEYYYGERTYLLKKLDYKGVQEFKRKYYQ